MAAFGMEYFTGCSRENGAQPITLAKERTNLVTNVESAEHLVHVEIGVQLTFIKQFDDLVKHFGLEFTINTDFDDAPRRLGE
jgi:hypothetical protein